MSRDRTSLGRFVVLQSATSEITELTRSLREMGEVVPVSQISQVQDGDWVVASPADFQGAVAREADARLEAILTGSGQAVCTIDSLGKIIWANSKLRDCPADIIERLCAHCVESASDALAGGIRARFLSLTSGDDRHYEATFTPATDQNQRVDRLVVFLADVTRSRRLQQKMDAIDNAGRELVRVDVEHLARLDVRQRLELLEQKIIRYTRELLHFDNFAIRLLDKKSDKLELVWSMGLPPEAQHVDIYASTENNGISGYVAATGRSYICPDVSKDPRYIVGIDNARSSLTAPLRLHDQVIGVFNIESDKLNAFTEEDRQFVEIFGRYVAIALHILDLLVLERHTTTGRLASNVSAEISGPLGDILAEASTLMEEYIGHDDLRHRLQAISDNVVKARNTIRQVARPTVGILGSAPRKPEVDPLLAGRLVLVADDEENIRITVRDVLTRYGCEVDTARDGTEALAMINRRSYDLVVSDIRMPGSDGYKVFQAVKDRNAGCPVIFMTGFGYDPNHCVIRANKQGLSAVLYKPFKVDQLMADVRAAIAALTNPASK